LILFFEIDFIYSEMTDEQFYSDKIDNIIQKCTYIDKRLSGSCMLSMQKYGALNLLKAAYISYYRDNLVRGLIYNKNSIQRKDYKITQYVNKSFFDIFRLANGEFQEQEIKSPYPVEE
jgi:hypothetical protein